jgi:hypothetical protein
MSEQGLHFDKHQFEHRVYSNDARDENGDGIDWAESRRVGVQEHKPRCAKWTPPFVYDAEKLKKVLLVRAWQYVYGRFAFSDDVEWEDINLKATARALRYEHQVSKTAPLIQHEIAKCHVNAVKRAGGYLELQAAIAFRAWRLGQDSVTVAESLGIPPTSVRQSLCRMKRIAFHLGYQTGAANHRRGPEYSNQYAHKKRKLLRKGEEQRGRPCVNLAGLRFGRLVAIAPISERAPSGGVMWLCKCDCGCVTTVWVQSLKGGNTKSCGCLQRECAAARLAKKKTGSEYRL